MKNKEKRVCLYVWLCPDCNSVSIRPYCPECRKKLDFIKNTFLMRFNLASRKKHETLLFI